LLRAISEAVTAPSHPPSRIGWNEVLKMAAKLVHRETSTPRRRADPNSDRDLAALPRSSRFRSHDDDHDESFTRLRPTARYQGFDGEASEDQFYH
jgi:hypothetical protein